MSESYSFLKRRSVARTQFLFVLFEKRACQEHCFLLGNFSTAGSWILDYVFPANFHFSIAFNFCFWIFSNWLPQVVNFHFISHRSFSCIHRKSMVECATFNDWFPMNSSSCIFLALNSSIFITSPARYMHIASIQTPLQFHHLHFFGSTPFGQPGLSRCWISAAQPLDQLPWIPTRCRRWPTPAPRTAGWVHGSRPRVEVNQKNCLKKGA